MPPRAKTACETVWQQNGLQSIETRVIRIRVSYTDFDDFWTSQQRTGGAVRQCHRQAVAGEERRAARRMLRERLPQAPDGSISYEPFANAVKGRVAA